MASKRSRFQKPENDCTIQKGLNDDLEKPESLTPKQRKIRENLSRFSTELEFNPLDLYEAWIILRYHENLPYSILLISHITRELLDSICKFETDDQPTNERIIVDSEIEEFNLEDDVKDKFIVDRSLKEMSWRGPMQETERNYLLDLSEKQNFKFCIWELYKKCSDRREGEIERKLKALFRRMDPQNSELGNKQIIETEFMYLRRYFSGLSHVKKEHHYQDREFEDNILRVEEILELISKDQMSIFDDIDDLLL